MSVWFRDLLLVLTIGGGFGGIMLTLTRLGVANQPVQYYAITALFIVLYGYGIFAGLRLAGSVVPYGHLFAYYALQVPLVLSPLFSYRFTSGFDIMFEIIGLRIGCVFNVGSDWRLGFLTPDPWGVGVNVLALVVIFSIYVHRFYERGGEATLERAKKEEPQPYDYLLPSHAKP